jgi:CBS domain-containing protein
MHVKEAMTQYPEAIPSDASLATASIRMAHLNVGVMPVEKGNDYVGIITDRDIVVRGLARQLDPSRTQVSEIMTSELLTCNQSADVSEAVEIMEENQVRRLIVVDDEGKAVGIISLGDIATKIDVASGGEVLSRVSEPSMPAR